MRDEARDAVIGLDEQNRILFVVHIEVHGEFIRIILENVVDGFVGANLFARTAVYVRMNSHLRELHNSLKYLNVDCPTAFFRIISARKATFQERKDHDF